MHSSAPSPNLHRNFVAGLTTYQRLGWSVAGRRYFWMGSVRKLEAPSMGKWLLAAGAVVLAGVAIAAMVLFAQAANKNTGLVNWFGIVTALGGALAFELLKYAITTRSRHLEELSTRISLTPAKKDELAALLIEVDKTRRLYSGLSSAIEMRAKELALEYERTELQQRAEELKRASIDLRQRQHQLALDAEARRSTDITDEMNAVLDTLGVSKQDRLLDQLWRSIGVVPGLPGGFLFSSLAEAGQREIERLLARRQRAKVANIDLGAAPEATTPPEEMPSGSPGDLGASDHRRET
jgi:hypothetical protein